MTQKECFTPKAWEKTEGKSPRDLAADALWSIIDIYCNKTDLNYPLFKAKLSVVEQILTKEIDHFYNYRCKKAGTLLYTTVMAEAKECSRVATRYSSEIKRHVPLNEHDWALAALIYSRKRIAELLPLPETEIISIEEAKKVFYYTTFKYLRAYCSKKVFTQLLRAKFRSEGDVALELQEGANNYVLNEIASDEAW